MKHSNADFLVSHNQTDLCQLTIGPVRAHDERELLDIMENFGLSFDADNTEPVVTFRDGAEDFSEFWYSVSGEDLFMFCGPDMEPVDESDFEVIFARMEKIQPRVICTLQRMNQDGITSEVISFSYDRENNSYISETYETCVPSQSRWVDQATRRSIKPADRTDPEMSQNAAMNVVAFDRTARLIKSGRI